MSTKIYDSNRVTLSFMGIPISAGYAEDEFLTITQTSPDFVKVVGTDGEVTRSKTNDHSATIEVKLMQSSDGNVALSVLNNIDKLAPNGAGTGPMLIKDLQGTSLYSAAICWIAKPPDVSFGKSAKERVWTLECGNLVRLDGGN